jgi:hypothetical protein
LIIYREKREELTQRDTKAFAKLRLSQRDTEKKRITP